MMIINNKPEILSLSFAKDASFFAAFPDRPYLTDPLSDRSFGSKQTPEYRLQKIDDLLRRYRHAPFLAKWSLLETLAFNNKTFLPWVSEPLPKRAFWIQTALKALGYEVDITGDFCAQTHAQLVAFRRSTVSVQKFLGLKRHVYDILNGISFVRENDTFCYPTDICHTILSDFDKRDRRFLSDLFAHLACPVPRLNPDKKLQVHKYFADNPDLKKPELYMVRPSSGSFLKFSSYATDCALHSAAEETLSTFTLVHPNQCSFAHCSSFSPIFVRDYYIKIGHHFALPDGGEEKDFLTIAKPLTEDLKRLGGNPKIVKNSFVEGGQVIVDEGCKKIYIQIYNFDYMIMIKNFIEHIEQEGFEGWHIVPVLAREMDQLHGAIYHLDLGMSPVTHRGDVLLCEDFLMADSYSQLRDSLQDSGRSIIPISREDAIHSTTNLVALGDVLFMTYCTREVRQKLENRGYIVVGPDDFDFMPRNTFEMGFGGLHCMTNEIA
jgi:N-dimethylarginine dimethylaminohydrolase